MRQAPIRRKSAPDFIYSGGEETFTEADAAKADSLAEISGLAPETVLDLYAANDNWGKVIENIFLYKEILAQCEALGADNDYALSLIDEYELEPILAMLEYALELSFPVKQVTRLLDENKGGTELNLLLSEADAEVDASYDKYVAADENQIRQWWQKAASSDILAADEIAREKDMIRRCLFLKTMRTVG